ncbi:beta-propeller fold lactonase family protein [Nonomuraea endophytica]|uniref:beta-propeller fold lactonase family protein n=1 Tax=Nonomuraea endophytica TaxID=714136 RepID=UPI0037C52012
MYVTNILSNNVSTFDIEPSGRLALRDELTSAGGAPRSVVVTPDGRFAYTANGVTPMTSDDFNSISRYRITAGGNLVPLTPPATANGDPDALAVAPNGRTLYVVNRGTDTVLPFRVGADGQLVRLSDPVPTGAENARGIALTPDGRFLFVSHGDPLGTQQDWLTRFAVGGDGTLAPMGRRVPIGSAGGAMAVTPDGRFLYVPCSASQEVFGFRIGPDGELTSVPGRRFDAPDVPIAAVATPDGRHLFVAAGGLVISTSTKVSAYRIRTNGALEHLANVDAGRAPVSLTPTPDGRHLYVANLNSWDVSGFRIGRQGQLREIAGSPFPTGGRQPAFQSIVIRPNQGPAAAFTARAAATGRPTTFDATASTDPDGRIARYDWDFGDGTVLPDGGPKPAHVYRDTGTFQVRLAVTDDEGCTTLFVYNGTSALCTGSPAALATRTIVIPRELG